MKRAAKTQTRDQSRGSHWWLLLFLAVIVLVLFAWLRFGLPYASRIPANFSESLNVESYDNFYDATTNTYQGEQRSASNFSYRAVVQNGNLLTINNTFSVSTLTGQPIFSTSRLYAINAISGQHVLGHGDHDRSGYLFAPRMKGLAAQVRDKSPFDYWHVNYDSAAHMKFVQTEVLYGLRVYRYETNYTVDQTKELTGSLPGVGSEKGISDDVHLTLWVEPYTGRIIKYQDQTEAYYYNLSSGVRLYPWNKFHNVTSSSSAAKMAQLVVVQKQKIQSIGYGVSFIIITLGLIVIITPYAIIYLKRPSGRQDGTEPQDFVIPLVLSIMLLLFFSILAFITSQVSNQHSQSAFTSGSQAVTSSITGRLADYANVLRGGKGLFNASNSVERNEWTAYANAVNIQSEFPGIQGIGFAKFVKSSELKAFTTKTQASGFPAFTVFPSGERPYYVPVTYVEPFSADNQKAFGYDLASESTRQQAMNIARDTGQATITGKIVLVQDKASTQHTKAGFLMFQPVYRPADPGQSIAARQATIYGYVFAAFRVSDLMTGIFTQQSTDLGVELFDGTPAQGLSADHLIYANGMTPKKPHYTDISTINIYNHQWTIRTTAPASYASTFLVNAAPQRIFIAGIILSTLVFMLSYDLVTRRKKVIAYARTMTKHLRAANEALVAAQQEAEQRAHEAERLNSVTIDRELKMVALKNVVKTLKGGRDHGA